MTDSIRLRRTIKGEYAPRYYTLTGGDFQALLAAVKGLPVARFDGRERAWAVNGEGIKALRAAGHTVEQEPDFRLRTWEQEAMRGATIRVRLDFQYRHPDGTWHDGPSIRAEAEAESLDGLALGQQTRALVRETREPIEGAFLTATGGQRTLDALKRGIQTVAELAR